MNGPEALQKAYRMLDRPGSYSRTEAQRLIKQTLQTSFLDFSLEPKKRHFPSPDEAQAAYDKKDIQDFRDGISKYLKCSGGIRGYLNIPVPSKFAQQLRDELDYCGWDVRVISSSMLSSSGISRLKINGKKVNNDNDEF